MYLYNIGSKFDEAKKEEERKVEARRTRIVLGGYEVGKPHSDWLEQQPPQEEKKEKEEEKKASPSASQSLSPSSSS